MNKVNDPCSTYRVQLHKDFNFKDLRNIVSYLAELGIKTVYASPVFEAMPGSTHGYDGTNPNRINPEIGTEEELVELSKQFRAKGIQWLQDIVPNHLSFHENNQWLMDVLSKGQSSQYAPFFDIIWDHPRYGNRVMVPFPGSPLENYLQENAPAAENYVITDWKETDHSINYRRFFTVNALICMNVQNETVFQTYHELIGKLVHSNTFSGLRVDHIDGLYDPKKYLYELRALTGASTYVVVEKILEPDENLPDNWDVQGTSGYEFLGMVNNLFTNHAAQQSFDELYLEITGDETSVQELIRQKKSDILYGHMGGELDNLVRLYKTLGGGTGMTEDAIRDGIAGYLIACPVYRYYGKDIPYMPQDENGGNEQLAEFYRRAMQFTGPLMAKGVEDTLMYTYNRFIGHNEVGDAPQAFGIGADKFHDLMEYRKKHWPLSLNTTSTHDTKRGEDARARLNAVTDFYEEWTLLVRTWRTVLASLKTNGMPDANDEYFIYQSLIATFPYPGPEGSENTDASCELMTQYRDRIQEYLQKALREAKVHSTWAETNQEYENAAIHFAHALIDGKNDFHHTFLPFLQKISGHSMLNSLSQLLLKFTCPGIPDTYQGTELWDLSLVDPDNRRAVDYSIRKEMIATGTSFHQLWEDRTNGQIKLALLQQLSAIRSRYLDIFSHGEYIPLQLEGTFKNNAIAFLRSHEGRNILVAVPLHQQQVSNDILAADWADTKIILPPGYQSRWEDVLKGTAVKEVSLQELFQTFPLAIVANQ